MQIEITLPLHTHTELEAIQYGEIDAAVEIDSDGRGGWEVIDCYVYDLTKHRMAKVTEERLCKLIRTHAVEQCFDHINEIYFTTYPRPARDQHAEHRLDKHHLI